MRAYLLRIWALPWPPRLRRAIGSFISRAPAQRLLIPHFRVGVVAVLRDTQSRYLLFRHTYRTVCPWGLPTGFLEHGEQPQRGLEREIEEESSLTVALGPVWHVYVEPGEVINVVFRGVVTQGSFRASAEVSEARWFAPHEIPTLMPGQAELVALSAQEDSHGDSA